MSDQWNDGDGATTPNEGGGHQPPPPPPPPPGADASSLPPVELTLDDRTEIRRSGGIGARAVAAIVGVLVLLAGTVFALTQASGGGAGTAEDAVAAMIDAVGDEDLLGMMAALDPGERDAMRAPVEAMFGELERLQVLDDSFELSGIEGIDFEFRDVTYRTEEVRDGLARVYFTGGTVTSSIDSAELPIGSFVTDTVERFGGEIDFQESETADMADGDPFLAAVRHGDSWHVSLGYTLAEVARLDAGVAYPSDGGVAPMGADSPEAAVEGMVRALFALDVREAIGRLSPGEFQALQEYAGLFLDDAEDAIASVQDEFTLTLDDIDLRSDTDGDRASVFIDGFAFTVEVDGSSYSIAYADRCVTLRGDLDELDPAFEEGLNDVGLSLDGPICVDDLEEIATETTTGLQPDSFEFPEFPEFPQLDAPEFGITTTRHDGGWFVAPIGTSLDGWVAFLEVLDRDDLDAIVDFVDEAINSFFGAFSTGFPIGEDFEATGGMIGGDDFDDGLGGPVDIVTPGVDGFDSIDFEGLFALLEARFPDDFDMQDCFFFALTNADPELVNEIVAAHPDEPKSTEARALLDEVALGCSR